MGLKTNTVPKDQLDSVLKQLGEIRHVDLSSYKRSTLGRRMELRMRIRHCSTAAQYCTLLQREPAEVDALVSAFFIKLTSFFRAPELWQKLRDSVLPRIIEQAGPDGEFRVWSVGCASGEEAYSIAILLSELNIRYDFSFKVFGTDRDAGVVATAGRGRFSSAQVRGLSPDVLERWFDPTEDGYVARRELRRSIIFGVQDLVADAPISRLDLILCRNLFIYLDSAGQRRSLTHLHKALKPDGVMVLGKSELLPASNRFFVPLELPMRIYRKYAAGPFEAFGLVAPKGAASTPIGNHDGTRERTCAGAIDMVDCAVVVVSRQGVVTLWNYGSERLYGRMASEVVGKPIGRLKLDGTVGERLLELAGSGALSSESRAEEIFTLREGATRTVRLKVRGFEVGEESGVICLAGDVTELTQALHNMRLAEERAEQIHTKSRETIAHLTAAREELERANEELRSANQELQTTNEELASTNEELEAMNEELQLTNAEFEAVVRSQPGAGGADTGSASLLQEALIRSSAIAVIGFDEYGRVNLCNPGAQRLFGCVENQMLRRSLQRLPLLPFPEHIAGQIKESFRRKLALTVEAFECEIDARKVKLSCRLTPLIDDSGNAGALLIVEPLHGNGAGLPWP